MGPTSVHEETGAGVENEYTADETEYTAEDYELPAGESNSSYQHCDWGDYLSAEPSDAKTVDESVVSSSLAGTVQQFPVWSKLNVVATELAMYGRVPQLDLVFSGHLNAEESAIALWGQQYNSSLIDCSPSSQQWMSTDGLLVTCLMQRMKVVDRTLQFETDTTWRTQRFSIDRPTCTACHP
jgi:hypothetical protein